MNPIKQTTKRPRATGSTTIDSTTPGTCKVRIEVDGASTIAVEVDGYDAQGEHYSGRSAFPECPPSAAVIEAARDRLFAHLAEHRNAIAIDYAFTHAPQREPRAYELWLLLGRGWKKAGEASERGLQDLAASHIAASSGVPAFRPSANAL